jgi:hypothetical protein
MKRKLGEILVEMRAAQARDVNDVLREQAGGDPNRLGELLVALGKISPGQLARALSEQHLVPFMRIPRIRPEVVALVSSEFQKAHRLVPIRASGRDLTIALADPTTLEAVELLRGAWAKVHIFVAASDEIDAIHESLAPDGAPMAELRKQQRPLPPTGSGLATAERRRSTSSDQDLFEVDDAPFLASDRPSSASVPREIDDSPFFADGDAGGRRPTPALQQVAAPLATTSPGPEDLALQLPAWLQTEKDLSPPPGVATSWTGALEALDSSELSLALARALVRRGILTEQDLISALGDVK